MVNMRKLISVLLLIALAAGVLAGCHVREAPDSLHTAEGPTLADFETAAIGILSGSSFDPLAKERFPRAERRYFSIIPDMILAVEQGKIDGYLSELPYVTAALWEGANVQAVGEVIDRTSAGFIFRQNSPHAEVREQLNVFIRNAKESGLLDALYDKWLGSTEPTEMPDHNQDGYGVYGAERFFYNFTFFDFFGDAPDHARDMCFAAVRPAQA